jgi:hypothetical protein
MAMLYVCCDNISAHVANIFTLMVLVAVMILILSITFSTPYLTDSGPLSSKPHTIMVVGITVLSHNTQLDRHFSNAQFVSPGY